MDRFLSWLSTEFPPGWFDGMKLAPDLLSIVNFALVAFLGWKTLDFRKKTNLELLFARHIGPKEDSHEWTELCVKNNGHYPAHGLTIKVEIEGESWEPWVAGEVAPWEVVDTSIRIKNFDGAKFIATYLDADNKLTRQKLKPGRLQPYFPVNKQEGKVIEWFERQTSNA